MQIPEHDAIQTDTVWHKATDVSYQLRVSVRESDIESLFCHEVRKNDGSFMRTSKVCVCV